MKYGERYKDLKKCVSICVLDFPYMNNKPEYHFIHKIMDTKYHQLFTDFLEIHYLSLPKISKELNVENKEQLWLHLIRAQTKEEFDMLKNTGMPEINKAVNVIYEMSDDEKLQELIWIREKAKHDEASRIGEAVDKARAEGMLEMLEMMKTIGGIDESKIQELYNHINKK